MNVVEVADVLERAADRIDKRGAWTRNVGARDADGAWVDSDDPLAVAWCAEGALVVEAPTLDIYDVAWDAACDECDARLADFNDAQSRRRPVVRLLRRTARKLRKEADDG